MPVVEMRYNMSEQRARLHSGDGDIQKGLEAFLQQELQEMQTSGSGSGKSGTGKQTAERPAPQMFDMNEDDEDEENWT